jgi:hypothetical protein
MSSLGKRLIKSAKEARMLTTEQINARKGRLTASRVACLMTGDATRIASLWLELIDDPTFIPPENYPAFIPEDLSQNWPVRLGECTEQLQLDWYEMRGNPVSRRGDVAVHPDETWAAATLDGWDDILHCPIECKHVGGREPLEVIIDRYSPQVQWQMFVTDARQCAFSVIFGANVPIVEYLERDESYIQEMVRRGRQFMGFVERREPPVVLPPVPAPIVATKTIDMTGDAEWRQAAEQWLQVYGAAATARDSEKILKSMVPDEAKKAIGAGVQITRDRAGRLSLRKESTT